MLHTAIIGGATLSGKREKFVELAEARVSRTMKDIRLIGNLSNRAAYEFTDEDIKQIFRALHKELEAAKLRFTERGSPQDGGFKLG